MDNPLPQLVELEASNSELEDSNTRLEAAAMRAEVERSQLRTALEAKDHQLAALKVCGTRVLKMSLIPEILRAISDPSAAARARF